MKQFKALTFLFITLLAGKANAQYEYVQKGEFGITAGAAHYFGDINTRAALNRPKPALGIFFRKQFGNYTGLRISAHYAQLGYSDVYSKNDYQKTRNLSFNTNIWEIALQGDFNFFKFVPNNPDYLFTPYITLGAGIFTYDPYAYTGGKKEFLRPLGTEGQTIGYKGRKQYSAMAFSFPLGVGVKYNISEKINLSFEVAQRFTTTDYLDDVSTTYAPAAFPLDPTTGVPPMGFFLHDRSYEYGTSIGIEGRQRGNSLANDAFATFQVGISFNLQKYVCPKF
jgi:hypothetical protein